ARALLEASSLKVEHLARVEMPHSGEAVSLAQDALPPGVEEWLQKPPESQTFQYIFRCQVDPSSARGAPTATTAGNEADRRDDPVIRLQAQALVDMEGELRQLVDLRSRMDAQVRDLNVERAQW